ncbi:MAG: Ig-like domain-containing protein [Gemmatimonadales bacterium]
MRMVPGALACALLVISCGGDELLLPVEGEPATLAIVEGDGQTGPIGGQLAEPLVVRVTDTRGRPVAGTSVAFASADGSVAPEATTTDADGLASTQWSLGMETGTQALEASVSGASPPLAVRFTAIASAGAARGLIIVSGNGQSAPAGSTLPAALVVRLLDGSGNPISGGAVSWVVGQGGGRVDPATSTTAADGTTSASWTLGPAVGANTLSAVVSGVGTVEFTATGTAAAAARLLLNGGNDQSAPAQSPLAAPLSVKAVDANGNGVGGVAVAWAVTAGGGSLSAPSSTTRADGTAEVTWTLGSAVGAQTATASAAGLEGSPVTFTATATIGAASRLAIVTQPSSSASSGVPLAQQPVIQLRDASGNAVPQGGVNVTVTIASGDGTLNGTRTRPTDGNGRATFTDLSISGSPGTRTLIFAADGFSSVTSSAIQVGPGAPSPSESRLSADPTSFEAGSGSSTITVTVRDGQGTPVPGVPVQLTVTGTGNTVAQPGLTNSSGVATGSFTSTDAESKTVSATAAGVQIQQTATVAVEAPPPPPPTADAARTTADVPNGVVGVATVITVQARDATGAALTTGGDAIAVSVSGSNNASGLAVTDNGDGTYTASYTPQMTGVDQVAVTLAGVPIGGSPYTSTVVAPSASQLGFLTQPGNERRGRPIRPPIEVAVQDRFENVVTGSSAPVTLAIGQGAGEDARLEGTLTRSSVGGVATFDDVVIQEEGEYTLRATSPGLDSRESRAFRVKD